MRITHLPTGQEFNLKPDTKIEVERTNPFFNDYGEQTTPLELPASERNRRLLGFPDTFGRRTKAEPVDVAIHDGEYFAQCRQVILSAQHKGAISTAFYINDGSFYSRIQKIKLKDIFKDEFVPGVDNVKEGIAFCRRLRDNTDERFGICPLLVENDSGVDTGFNFKIINAFGKQTDIPERKVWVWKDNQYKEETAPEVSVFHPDTDDSGCDFYNAVQRTEYVNQIPITLTEGYYISPFIRANYLLKRVFAHFGYDLLPNFFTETEPFSKMLVLNTVIDTLVNGRIRLADLVPDVSCADFLAVFRKKFCCEFTSDEGKRTAEVIFLRDALAARPEADLTRCVTEEPTIAYKAEKDYQRVVLMSEEKVDTDIADSYDDMKAMAAANPAAFFNPIDGAFYKTGFSGDYSVNTRIGEASQDYNTGEQMEAKEIKIPDLMPEFRVLKYTTSVDGTPVTTEFGSFLFAGRYVTLNSKMKIAGGDNQADAESATKQRPMLAFSYLSAGKPEATVSSYDLRSEATPRVFDYALFFHGPDGIFERFYRDYDLLLRNSLHDMKVKLLLSQAQKQNMPSYAKVVIRGVAFFFNKLKVTLGGKNEPAESELRTVALMEPVSLAPVLSDMFPLMSADYKWIGKSRVTSVSASDYNNSGLDKERTFITIYPPLPSEAYLNTEYGKQTSFTAQKTRHKTLFRPSKYKFTRTEVWLECEKK